MSETTDHATHEAEALFQSYTGQWAGMTRTWFEPGNLGDESAWQGSIQPILGGRYLQYDYTGTLQGEAFEGKAIIGHNSITNQFEMAWIDSFHQSAGIMHCKGEKTADGLSLLGSYRAIDDSGDWGWRTEFILVDADHLTIRAYNITPDGEESLGIETLYTRA